MSDRPRTLAAVLAAVLVVPALAACASASATPGDTIAVSGQTRAEFVTVGAAPLTLTGYDPTIGIAKAQTPTALAARRTSAGRAAQAASQRAAVPAGTLAHVYVRPGDRVRKGQILAVFDDRMLRLGVAYAQAGYRKAVAAAGTLHANASDLRDQRSKVYDAKALLRTQAALLAGAGGKLSGQAAQLKAQIPQLVAAKAGLRQARAGLEAQLAEAKKQAASPTPPPGIQGKIAGLKAAIAGVEAKLTKVEAALGQLEAAMPKLAAAQAQMAKGKAMMAAAKGKIGSALSKIDDGISQLENGSDTMRIASKAQGAGLGLARSALAEATVRAPEDGTVVRALSAGQVAMTGAPIVVLRPDSGTLVDTYLEPEQAARVKAGDPAEVTFDSVLGVQHGRVAVIASDQQFPPSNYPTQIVHLSAVVKVTVALPDRQLPLGVPVDVVIRPSK